MKSKDKLYQEILAAGPKGDQRPLIIFFILLVLAGTLSFLLGISGPQAQRIWQVYLVNFLFWSGLTFGTILFVAVLNMTNARWARPLQRIAEAPAAFLPVLFLLFWVLYFGREQILPWMHEPIPNKAAWLKPGFLFARDGAGLLLLTTVSLAMLYCSVHRDRRLAADQKSKEQGSVNPAPSTVGPEKQQDRGYAWRVQVVLSPILGILYALVLSLIAFDLIMSLDQHWLSTLFGAYYFVGSFYTALAAVVLLSYLAMTYMGTKQFIQPKHFHDLGKLLLGFCLVTGDFFYSQFLVIWYGNLPEETRYVILRVQHTPWGSLAWTVLIVCFVIPFGVLLSRKIKLQPKSMVLVSCLILVGMWLERFLLVAPSLWKGQEIPLGLPELLITGGFLGAMAITVMFFFKKFPILPLSDLLFDEALQAARGQHR